MGLPVTTKGTRQHQPRNPQEDSFHQHRDAKLHPQAERKETPKPPNSGRKPDRCGIQPSFPPLNH